MFSSVLKYRLLQLIGHFSVDPSSLLFLKRFSGKTEQHADYLPLDYEFKTRFGASASLNFCQIRKTKFADFNTFFQGFQTLNEPAIISTKIIVCTVNNENS